MLADELLADARRIVALEAESKRVNSELARAKAEYTAKVEKLTNADATMVINQIQRNGGSNGPIEGPLRNQILALLRVAERPLSLDEIQEKTGEQRAKIMWTLANLKRAELAENSRRGFWQRGKADVEEGRNEPDDPEPEISF